VDSVRRRARETARQYSWARTAEATLEFCERRRAARGRRAEAR